MADRPAWVKIPNDLAASMNRHKCLGPGCAHQVPLTRLPLCERHWHLLEVEHGLTYDTPAGRQFVPYTRLGELALATKFNPKQAIRYERGVYSL